MTKIKSTMKSILLFFNNTWTGSIILILIIVNFLYQSFVIPSGSMRSTLLEGDFVIVNKFAYGTPIPTIPWIEIPLFPDLKENGHIFEGDRPKREDIVIFRGERTDFNYYVKRCVAIENDILFFENGDFYLHFNEGDEWIKKNYPKHQYYISKKYGIFVKNPYMEKYKGIQNIIYSHKKAVKLEKDYYENFDLVLKYEREGKNPTKDSIEYFTKNGLKGSFEEMKKEYLDIVNNELEQTLYYPQNFPNHPLLGTLKEDFKNVDFIKDETKMFVKIKKDKFFMVGDNRNYSKDSRFMDAVPYKELKGKLVGVWASFIYFSEERPELQYQPRWHRFGSDLEDLNNSKFETYKNEVLYKNPIIGWDEILKQRLEEISNENINKVENTQNKK